MININQVCFTSPLAERLLSNNKAPAPDAASLTEVDCKGKKWFQWTGALKKVNGITKAEDYVQIVQETLKLSVRRLILGTVGCSNRTVILKTHQN